MRDAPGSPTIADRRRPGAAPPEPAARRGRLRRRAGRPAPPAEEAAEPVAQPPAPETTERDRAPAGAGARRRGDRADRTHTGARARRRGDRAAAHADRRAPTDATARPPVEPTRADGTGRRTPRRPPASAPRRDRAGGARSPPRWPWPAARSCSPAATRSAARAASDPAAPAAPPADRAVAAEDLGVDVPGAWRELDAAPAVPGLSLVRSAAAAPPSGPGAVSFGMIDGGGASLLPSSFTDALGGVPKPDATVRLGDLEAYRYDALTAAGADDPVRLYASPTTSGVATVACTDGLPAERCDEIAATLHAGSSLIPLPLGPRAAYGKPSGRRARPARPAPQRRTAGARPRRHAPRPGQGGRGAWPPRTRGAAKALGAIEPGPLERDAHLTLVRALRNAAGAYRDAGAAARAGERRRYDELRGTARDADAAARRAVAALDRLGYRVA